MRYLLIALALLFAQQAAQLHSLSHLKQDLARAAAGNKGIPPVGHPAEQCIAFHAVDSALACGTLALEPPRVEPLEPALAALPLSRSPRIEFDSRAPPSLS
jgi:hypothetical protein